MKFTRPVLALIFPNDGNGTDNHARYALTAYGAFICSRLRDDADSYNNASAYVAGVREKELLIFLSSEKLADLKELDPGCSGPPEIADEWNKFESPSYTQYLLDVDFNLLLDISDVFHFAYRREYKTLELFNRIEQSTKQSEAKSLLSDAISRQRESILRLDAKLAAAARFDAFSPEEKDRTSLYPVSPL